MFNKKKFFVLILVFCFIVFGIFILSRAFSSKEISENKNQNQEEPASEPESFVVEGTSMSPVLEEGEEIFYDKEYYKKNPIQSDDIVIIGFDWREKPIVKFVRGIPGDGIALEKGDGENYFVLINGERIKNSEGEEYSLSYTKSRMIDLYARDYAGIIPNDAYFILGNSTSGTQDSTQFGLIHKDNIIGKVIK